MGEARLAPWGRRLGEGPGLTVGIAWSGRSDHRNDANRSIALARLAPLFGVPDVRFVSLQTELRAADAAALPRFPNLAHVGDELADFADTAAVASLVDLVISVDTAAAHLAGALAKPLWVLLPFSPDWRWMLGREDSPWYPTARLFRQSRAGDWDDVVARVRDALTARASTCRPPASPSRADRS
jgi:ADP-heptose:LPS heptosyltransferase